MLFSASGLRTLSEIARDVGQVFFASVVVVGPLVSGSVNATLAFFGLVLSLVFWIISIDLSSSHS